jgi:hypothetical protein
VEEEAGTKLISVRFRNDGGRMAGTITTQVGGVTMDTALRDVTYEKGALAFSASLGGTVRKFHGTLSGAQVSGTLDGGGTFELRFVE